MPLRTLLLIVLCLSFRHKRFGASAAIYVLS